MKYRIIVACQDHALRGVEGSFCQANHGKKAPLSQMEEDDWVIIYAPHEKYGTHSPLQQFIAIGQITGKDPYPYQMSETFIPWRRDVRFYPCIPQPIRPLIPELSFITNKTKWGYPFRRGVLEINDYDFNLIYQKMLFHE